MGFDAYFVSRIDADDKAQRMARKELEWIHRPYSKNLDLQIFGHEFSGELYRNPPGFDFGVHSNDEWTTSNAAEKGK